MTHKFAISFLIFVLVQTMWIRECKAQLFSGSAAGYNIFIADISRDENLQANGFDLNTYQLPEITWKHRSSKFSTSTAFSFVLLIAAFLWNKTRGDATIKNMERQYRVANPADSLRDEQLLTQPTNLLANLLSSHYKF